MTSSFGSISTAGKDSTMDNNATSNSKRRHKNNRHHNEDDDEEEAGDPQVWSTFNTTFRQVQSVLDRNRSLIQQVNENHQSRIPDNMVKNVALIQELNDVLA
ncbi:protein EARLY FLOWERING 4 isoform X2 [Ricinus communis]|uniref:protein EARLY FLOWERING 4 isoform X2 n=1 Tax=Ricinus communis TaxID=3988 RepID=UPI000D698F16|nr:protein EARLY FLOWERING 4 isoform X2 [Ricinus communis]|eukprot:XP_025015623.1 protein EARLY FLOWERING 4 isoform X2 [Ricinus communis]